MMMQIVQTSLSLIGFGFTITTFFSEVAGRLGGSSGGRGAPILGASLLIIGLLLLTLGTWNQSRYRRELRRRYEALGPGAATWSSHVRFTPSYTSAVLLMLVGLLSLGLVVVRWLF